MEVKISLFKLGLILVIGGCVWISFIFSESEKIQDMQILSQSSSMELKLEMSGNEIGFYKIFMPQFNGNEMFVQIRDNNGNVIQEEKIQTKMSVGYFELNEDGLYSIKATNISKTHIDLQLEFGNTSSQKMIPAGLLVLVGAITMIMISYLKLKNYSIAQPDENIS